LKFVQAKSLQRWAEPRPVISPLESSNLHIFDSILFVLLFIADVVQKEALLNILLLSNDCASCGKNDLNLFEFNEILLNKTLINLSQALEIIIHELDQVTKMPLLRWMG
jgi:hypothetical protein